MSSDTMYDEKLKRLKKQLLKDGGTFAGVLAVILVIYFALSSYEASLAEDKKKLARTVNRINSEAQELTNSLTRAKESLGLYEQLTAREQGEEPLDREEAMRLLADLKKRFKLASLSLVMAPPKAIPQEFLPSKTMGAEYSVVKLKFSGMTDEYLLSFVNAVSEEFKGYVRIDDLKINRDETITQTALAKVSRGEIPALTSGELTFHWFGLSEVKAEKG